MEDYERRFQKQKDGTLSSIKSTLAMSYWLRKMLTSVLRNNQLYKGAKSKGDQLSDDTVKVGISNTIGDEEISNFFINPDDIISAQGLIQRADRADRWMLVSKSEKMHRLHKKDFFSILQHFVQKDLNMILLDYGFREIDLRRQLIPELQERLEDIERIEAIRSAILGTGILSMEDYVGNTKFHNVFRRYFQKADYDNFNYPEREKFGAIAEGLMHSNTSILQMKYRKVLGVKEEMENRIKELKQIVRDRYNVEDRNEVKAQIQRTTGLNKILTKVLSIMILAKPSLQQVKLEGERFFPPDCSSILIKGGDTEDSEVTPVIQKI
jgi:hypothetical protein